MKTNKRCVIVVPHKNPFPPTRDTELLRFSATLLLLLKCHGMGLSRSTLSSKITSSGLSVASLAHRVHSHTTAVLVPTVTDIYDAHYKACIYTSINISGINGLVMPGQEQRINGIVGVVLSFNPKPILVIGMVLVSTPTTVPSQMREDGAYEVIKAAIKKLKLEEEDNAVYGEGALVQRSKSFEKDRLIDTMRDSDPREVYKLFFVVSLPLFDLFSIKFVSWGKVRLIC